MKIRKIYPQYLLIPALALLLFSCSERHPGIEYAPQMYHSIPMEPFTQVEGYEAPFADGRNQQIPPDGTVRYGKSGAYEFADVPNYPEPADLVKIQAMQNPVPYSAEALAKGEVLYQRFCAVCHGKKGAADGSITARAEIAPKPYDSESVKNKTEGEIYHTIMVGLNMMGSYSSQLNYEERWQVVHYVRKLQGNDPAEAAAAGGEADAGDNAGEEEGVEDLIEEEMEIEVAPGEEHDAEDHGHDHDEADGHSHN